LVPDAHATLFTWNVDADLSYGQTALPYLYLFSLMIIGFFFGYFLSKKVRPKFMLVGSAFYWATALSYLITANNIVSRTLPYENPLLYYSYVVIFWSIFLALSLNITYVAIRARMHLNSHYHKATRKNGISSSS
jgi:hypothetical protein